MILILLQKETQAFVFRRLTTLKELLFVFMTSVLIQISHIINVYYQTFPTV